MTGPQAEAPDRTPDIPQLKWGRQLLEYFEAERNHGSGYGAKQAALREVAELHGLDPESFGRYVRRYKDMREREVELRLKVKDDDDANPSALQHVGVLSDVLARLSPEIQSINNEQRRLQEQMRLMYQRHADEQRALRLEMLTEFRRLDALQRQLNAALATTARQMAGKISR